MQNLSKCATSNFQNKLIRHCALVFSSLILFSYNLFAQADSSSKNDGPSLDNSKKVVKAVGEQMSREEKMSYIGMAIGFILVMAIAWFSTNAAKKRRLAREEMIRRHHLNSHAKHNTHDPYYKSHASGVKVKQK